jgi:hypothetical protein
MRLVHKDVDVSHARVNIKAAWVDKMRRPSSVKIVVEKNVSAADLHPLIDGDPADVSKTLAGIASIAWGLGWRPEGLDAALSNALRTHEG